MTNIQLDKLLQKSTVRLSVSNIHGTGFFVSPELILTCAHVIGEANSSIITVFWKEENRIYTAEIERLLTDQGLDLALLRVNDGNCRFPCVYLDESPPQLNDNLYSYGYPQEYSDGDSATFRYEGESFKGNSLLYKLKEGQADYGLSGSPLLNLRTGGVSGVVSISRNPNSDLGGRAIPTTVIFAKIPELKQRQQEFHRRNRDWIDLLSGNIEAVDLDWEVLNFSGKRFINYITTILFLACVLAGWIFLGFFARFSFPFRSVLSILGHTIIGDLGEEIKHQQKQLKLSQIGAISNNDGDTKTFGKLNELDSHYWLVINIIDLISPQEASNSICRIFQTVETLDEQRVKILYLKRNSEHKYRAFLAVQRFWKRIQSKLENHIQRDYRQVEKILNYLITDYIVTVASTQSSIEGAVEGFSENLANNNPKLNFLLLESSLANLARGLAEAMPLFNMVSQQVEEILFDELKQNPKSKLLRKLLILLDWLLQRNEDVVLDSVGEDEVSVLILGGPVRAWKRKENKYHFERDCDRYPERVKLEDQDKIICYETRDEAESDNREPCKRCLYIAKKRDINI